MKLLEKQIEDVFERFYLELIEPDLKLIARQKTLKNKRRVDLLFKDKNNKDVVVELKRGKVTDKDVGQIVSYAGSIENSRVILASPQIDRSYKKSFEHYGIEYIEFDIRNIKKLYNQIQKQKTPKKEIINLPVFKEIVKEKINEKKLIDGNIAFKVSYNDKNWRGICSKKIYEENSFGKRKMFWCREQHNVENVKVCQLWNDYELSINNFPCYDSIANLELGFSPGWNHGKDKPHICLNAKVGKIALLTSLKPEKSQKERFIFSIFKIEKIKKIYDVEYYLGEKRTAINFSPKQYLNYWNYYKNKTSNNKFSKFWGSGLFRYINDEIIKLLLNDIINNKKFTNEQQKNAKILLSEF